EKSSVIRQPNAFKSQRPSVLGKPTTFSNSFVRKDFSKSTSVTQTRVSNDFSKPVTTQTLPTNNKSILKNMNVLAPKMYKLHTEHTQTRTSQLPGDFRKTKKRVSFSTGVIPTTSVSRPSLKSNPQGDRVMHNNSQGKKQEVEDHHRSVKLSKNKTSITLCNDSLNAKTLNVKSVSATCDKCVLIDKHDMCVLKSVAKPLKETVASKSNKKPRNFTRKLYERVSKTCSWWYPKFTQSGYKWKSKSGKENVNLNERSNLGMTKLHLFLVMEIWFKELKSMCFICDLKGNDLLTGSHDTDLYSITLQDTNCPNLICLMAKASSSQAWLWHRRLSHLNFDTINLLSKNDIMVGLPKVKFIKDHLCSSWIHHQTSVARTPEQNDVVERRNRNLVEAARTMLNAAKVPLFFWAEAIATACFTQNHYLVIPRHEKTPYHIINDRKPSVKFFHIFGSTCYIVIDGENLDKMKEKGDECIFVGYSTQSRAYRVFNKRTRVIMEFIHVNFDELPQMASDQISYDPAHECQTMALNHDSLSPAIQRQENVTQVDRTVTTSNELDLLFSLMFDELLNGSSKIVSKSFANINQAETYAENDQVADDEFINIFSTLIQDQGETSSRHVDSSNMYTFYHRYPSEHRWTKDHPLEQVIGNPSQSVRTRRQLESDAEMCMFALTVSRTKPKNIKEAMTDSA
nr:retrovirus-related Pol polyprotein from transposon TNT 1-94 [Tanacetum cinerariifolium]